MVWCANSDAFWPPRLHCVAGVCHPIILSQLMLLLVRLNKAGGGTVGGIYEMHVVRLPPRRINGKKDHRFFQNVRHRMDGAPFKEKELAGTKFGLPAFVFHPKCPSPGKNVEEFVALQVVMRRGALINPKNPGAGSLAVDQIVIEQQRGRCWRKGGS